MARALLDYRGSLKTNGGFQPLTGESAEPEQLAIILALLRARKKYDFHAYRKNMLLRRIHRRVSLCQAADLAHYVPMLRSNPEELERLFSDLLIGVTGFFRDPPAFEVLEQRVLARLAEHADHDSPVRVWVAGCATGEEAYSVAMLLHEAFERRAQIPNLQIYATDIDESALETARAGRYPKAIAADVSAARLQRFFVDDDIGHYRVNKQLRESVVFAPQNLIGDAPFSRLDLICCRNLLIYLEQPVQRKVIALFHFSLRPGGYLLLGTSESVGQQSDLFDTISKKWRLFQRIGRPRRETLSLPQAALPVGLALSPPSADGILGTQRPDLGALAGRLLLEDYGPAAVLVNRRYEILYFFGPAVDYLELPAGRPTLYLLDMLRQGLRTRVRAACHRAARDQRLIRIDDARVNRDGNQVRVQIRVRPLYEPPAMDGLILVSFTDIERPSTDGPNGESQEDDGALTQQLERELKATREDLQSSIEELESANEELKASNEEAMSTNEELQSANEELETSKEELQSLNEELTTVNCQLEEKVQELERSNNDITNLFASTEIATVFLDTKMRIVRFTPVSAKLLNLRTADAGRPLADLAPNFKDASLMPDSQLVLERLVPIEKEIKADNETHYLRRIQPYRTHDNRIEGVVISFIDITLGWQADATIRASEQRYRMLFERSPMCLMEQDWSDVKLRLASLCNDDSADLADWAGANPAQVTACREQVRLNAINRSTLVLLGAESTEQIEIASQRCLPLTPTGAFIALLQDLLRGHSSVQEFDVHTLDGKSIPVLAHVVPAFGHNFDLARVLIAIIDISQRKVMEQRLADREQRLSAILNTVADGIVGVDASGTIGEFNAAAERLFACSAPDATGRNLSAFLRPGPAQDAASDLMQLLRTPGDQPIRARLCEGARADGTLFPAEMVGAEVDHLGLYVLLVRDISERRELERQIIETSTREQQRIGQEIHDGLGQQLTAVTMLAATLAGKLEKAGSSEATEARALAQQIDRALGDSRRITQGLAPVGVAPEALVDAIDALADQVQRASGVQCELIRTGKAPVTDPVVTAHLYRIAQEAINNAARHGKPSRIEVRLEQQDGMIQLSVSDDGEWQKSPKSRPGGLGLHIMGYRAGILGGKLKVSPQQGGGTLLQCEIPVPTN
ncbi:MAG: CheR family methyltransferase [Thiohalocapsa sp.]